MKQINGVISNILFPLLSLCFKTVTLIMFYIYLNHNVFPRKINIYIYIYIIFTFNDKFYFITINFSIIIYYAEIYKCYILTF